MLLLHRRETFRKLLLRIGEICSLLPSNVNIMALTATASKQLWMDVSRIIGTTNELVVAKPPSKSNIMYTIATFSTIEETFLPIVKKVEKERVRCPRIAGIIKTVLIYASFLKVTSV